MHTGDFRREDWGGRGSMLGYNKHRGNDGDGEGTGLQGLPECLTRAPLDLLLLDNTYCNPVYRFPTRADAAAEVVRLIVVGPRTK